MRTWNRRPRASTVFALVSGVGLFFGTIWVAPAIGIAPAGALPAGSAAALPSTGPLANRPSDCPSSAVCLSIPCKHRGRCPTVEATPVTELGQSQWVYLNLSNFPAGNSVQVDFCTDTRPLSPSRPPLCDVSGSETLPYPQQVLSIFPNGTAVTSFHVELVPHSPGNIPFSGVEVGTEPERKGTFYCDDGPDFCSIDLIDPALSSDGALTPAADNSVVMPVRFQASDNGCPSAQFMFTSSDFSVEQLFPHESPFACQGAHPVIPINTAADSAESLGSLVSGSTQMGFFNDPLSPEISAALAKTKTHYWYIPVAASAVVLAYQATMLQEPGTMYGYNSEQLTPSQVAGLITFNYSTPDENDVVECPASVEKILSGGFPSPAAPCPLIEVQNVTYGYVPAQEYGAFLPAYHSGVTRELLSWLCSAPNVPVKVDGATIKDPTLASHELTTSDFDKQWPIKSCAPLDQFPAIPSPAGSQYALLASPAVQAKFLRSWLPPAEFETGPQAAFAPMDWSEAVYQGLGEVSLQNAAGKFISPSAESIDAALAAAKAGPDGVLEPNFDAKAADAYPMPEITYAVVPQPSTAAEVTEDSNLLDSLLAYTGGAGATSLPGGFVPLPAAIYRQALVDVQKEIVLPKTHTHPGGSGGGNPPPTTTTTTIPVAPPTTTTVPAPPKRSHPVSHPRRPVRRRPPTVAKPPPIISYSTVPLLASGDRWTLPVVGLGGSVSLVPGGVLVLVSRLRKRRKK